MNLIRQLWAAALSLRTPAWLLGGLLMLSTAGAVQMPAMKAYESMNSTHLFEWVLDQRTGVTWWIWGSIVLLTLLALNTLACSAESLLKKRAGRHWLLVISPQIIHIGFMFMLLAHLMSASSGFNGSVWVREGSVINLPSGSTMQVERIDLILSPRGFPLDWSTNIKFISPDQPAPIAGVMAPNKPSFHKGYGHYLKQVRPGAALIEERR